MKASQPLHVTLRVQRDVGTLRRRELYRACRGALQSVLGRHDFRIAEISLQDRHLHLVVEANDKTALARGMQAFEISAARRINRAIFETTRVRRRGKVFSDRYHARALTTPRQVRHALAYVLNNWRRHDEDKGPESMFWTIDPYSSAIHFAGWRERGGERFPRPPGYEPLPVAGAESWLLRAGWRKHGLISVREVPGPRIAKLVA